MATSGDTGKAALEGFADVEGVSIFVFYPHGGVSEIQRLQMVTQRGSNTGACAVIGNFDDAQTGVKKIFSDSAVNRRLEESRFRLSSANSINWGRLAPQIAYYYTAYEEMVLSWESDAWPEDQYLRSHRKFREYPCRLLCHPVRTSCLEADLCLQHQQGFDRFHPNRGL